MCNTFHDLPNRLNSKINRTGDGCWLWLGCTQSNGYGVCWNGRRPEQSHRVVYRMLVGDWPGDKELDHRCRNRNCVNPDHLEVVTHRENMRRSNTIMGVNARKTHCIHGHSLSGDNLRVLANGARQCRECLRRHAKAARAKRKAIANP